MSGLHLSDDRLIEIACDPQTSPTELAHLFDCAACEARRLELALTIDEVGEVLAQQADEVFPAERLARQRAKILQRVEQDGRPARVIAFPASHIGDGVMLRPRRSARWGTVAAAVAASFVVGLLADHLAHDFPGTQQSRAPARIVRQTTPPAANRAAQSDDELLGQLELAGAGVGPAALRPLDALTPRAWDVR